MNYFKCIIQGDTWNIYLIDDDDSVIEEDAVAEVKKDDFEIFFKKSELSLKVVLHELWHVFFSYCCLADTNSIVISDLEEITATLFETRSQIILKLGQEIYAKLEELKNKK